MHSGGPSQSGRLSLRRAIALVLLLAASREPRFEAVVILGAATFVPLSGFPWRRSQWTGTGIGRVQAISILTSLLVCLSCPICGPGV